MFLKRDEAVHILLAENQHMASPNKDVIEKYTKMVLKNNERGNIWKQK